jgi:NAD(P)-dependent dehydrogenase (short-subunit alcohol dehydrogenase family)
MQDFGGKLAVITGGASGIGRAIADRLAREGARIVLADVEEEALGRAVDDMRSAGADAHGVTVDVTKFESVEAAAATITDTQGPIHILCNNAGVGALEDVPLWELPLSDWRWTFAVNVWGVIHGIKAFLPGMLAHGERGHIVNTSSGNGGLILVPSTPIYSASKATVSTITETLHLQLTAQQANIKASVLYPGPNVVASNIFDAKRNRSAEFKREAPQIMDPITLDDMKGFYEAMGQEFAVTQPEEVAEHFLVGIKADKYYILPASDQADERIRRRTQAVLDRVDPEAIGM